MCRTEDSGVQRLLGVAMPWENNRNSCSSVVQFVQPSHYRNWIEENVPDFAESTHKEERTYHKAASLVKRGDATSVCMLHTHVVCTCSLLSPSAALSSANPCLPPASKKNASWVCAGNVQFLDISDIDENTQTLTVSDYLPHPDGLMLVFVKGIFNATHSISWAVLPDQSTTLDGWSKSCALYGFGYGSPGHEDYEMVCAVANVSCQEAADAAGAITCGQHARQAVACRGDEGGPLMCTEDDGVQRLLGVAMPWEDSKTCSSVVTFLYTGHYRKWIEEVVAYFPEETYSLKETYNKAANLVEKGDARSVCMLHTHVVCTCSLLSPSAALSSARPCLPPHSHKAKSWVCAGDVQYWDISDTDSNMQKLEVSEYLPHPDGLMLVIVKGVFNETPTVSWAPLPHHTGTIDVWNKSCALYGFGYGSSGHEDVDMVCSVANVSCKIAADAAGALTCGQQVGLAVACRGDEGGPLMCTEDDSAQRLLGVAMPWKENRTCSSVITVLRIDHYRKWIKENVADIPDKTFREAFNYSKGASVVQRGDARSVCMLCTDVVCTCSLLSPSTALSSTIPCRPPDNYKSPSYVYVGNVQYREGSDKDSDTQKLEVSGYLPHPDGLMLVFVNGRFNLTDTVDCSLLPFRITVPDGWNKECEVYGFGYGSIGHEAYNKVCAVASVRCQADATGTLVCGRQEGVAVACRGDEGGPLMCSDGSGVQHLLGVTMPWDNSTGCSSVIKFRHTGAFRVWIEKNVPDITRIMEPIFHKEAITVQRGDARSVCMLYTHMVCTCSLLSAVAALTSARPCRPPDSHRSNKWVYAGNVEYRDVSDIDAESQVLKVSYYLEHPDGLMLVFVSGTFLVTYTINWALLPHQTTMPDGWNKSYDLFGFGYGSYDLEDDDMVCAVARVRCRADNDVADTFSCGQRLGPAVACPGDQGGPLMFTEGNGVQRLLGVAMPWKNSQDCTSVVKFLHAGHYRKWIKRSLTEFPALKNRQEVSRSKEASVVPRGSARSVCMLQTDKICTCTLLSPSTALSSASPCLPPDSFRSPSFVLAGNVRFRDDSDVYDVDSQILHVRDYLLHPDGLMLVIIDGDFKETHTVSWAQLPDQTSVPDSWNQSCDVYGFGFKSILHKDDNMVCTKVKVRCQDAAAGTLTCSQRAGKAVACNGDEGGPLMCSDDDGVQRLMGVAMPWEDSEGCSSNVKFLHTGHYRKWIESSQADRSDETSGLEVKQSKEASVVQRGDARSVCLLQTDVVCTCSLLSPSVALSSASPCRPPDSHKPPSYVFAGNVQYGEARTVDGDFQMLDVSDYLPHPDGLMLVIIKGVFHETPTVSWALLPDQTTVPDNWSKSCGFYGFGFGSVDYEDQEDYEMVCTVANVSCQVAADTAGALTCMQQAGLAMACPGDEGGPLMCTEDDGVQRLLGVAMPWEDSEGCSPTVKFLHTGHYRTWIEQNKPDIPYKTDRPEPSYHKEATVVPRGVVTSVCMLLTHVVCTCSLLSPTAALSSASPCRPPDSRKDPSFVCAGNVQCRDDSDVDDDTQISKVSDYLMHPDGLMLVVIRDGFEMTPTVSWALLPIETTVLQDRSILCEMYGFGYGSFRHEDNDKVCAVTRVTCKEADDDDGDVTGALKCWQQEAEPMACPGDEGGPLMCTEDDGVRRLLGVAMPWEDSEGCSYTVKFLHTGHYRPWIEENMAESPDKAHKMEVTYYKESTVVVERGDARSVCMLHTHVVCTCSLLSPSVALSSEIPCRPPDNHTDKSYVYAGNVQYPDVSKIDADTQKLEVSDFLAHPAGLMLVILEDTFHETPTVSWAPLPDQADVPKGWSRSCEAYGFGFGSIDHQLEDKVCAVVKLTCQAAADDSTGALTCGQQAGAAVACPGDEGGPLFCIADDDGVQRLLGVAMPWEDSEGCTSDLKFLHTGHFRNWIKKNVADFPDVTQSLEPTFQKQAGIVQRGLAPWVCMLHTHLICTCSLLSPSAALSFVSPCRPRAGHTLSSWVYAGNVQYLNVSDIDAETQALKISDYLEHEDGLMLVMVKGSFLMTHTVTWALLSNQIVLPDGWNSSCDVYGFGFGSRDYEDDDMVCAVARVPCRADAAGALVCGQQAAPAMACPGDEGGPLMCTEDDGVQRLLGVAKSWEDISGCTSTVNFLHIGHYRNWIEKSLAEFPNLAHKLKAEHYKDAKEVSRGKEPSVCMVKTHVTCTCSLLSPTAALSSVRPCRPPASYNNSWVYAGHVTYRPSSDDDAGIQKLRVSRFLSHPHRGLMLVFVGGSFNQTHFVDWALLPDHSTLPRGWSESCDLYGFGLSSSADRGDDKVCAVANVRCQADASGTLTCGQEAGALVVCSGDQGGPLMCTVDGGVQRLLGVAMPWEKNKLCSPVVKFGHTGRYIRWIEENVADLPKSPDRGAVSYSKEAKPVERYDTPRSWTSVCMLQTHVICTCSLLSQRTALTSARPCHPPAGYNSTSWVHVGHVTYRLLAFRQLAAGDHGIQKLKVVHFLPHGDRGLMLVFTNENFKKTQFVSWAQLPIRSIVPHGWSRDCDFYGFGYSDRSSQDSAVCRVATASCHEAATSGILTCGLHQRKPLACPGDEGGPLMCTEDGTGRRLLGVAMPWEDKGCASVVNFIYTGPHSEWIQKNLKDFPQEAHTTDQNPNKDAKLVDRDLKPRSWTSVCMLHTTDICTCSILAPRAVLSSAKRCQPPADYELSAWAQGGHVNYAPLEAWDSHVQAYRIDRYLPHQDGGLMLVFTEEEFHLSHYVTWAVLSDQDTVPDGWSQTCDIYGFGWGQESTSGDTDKDRICRVSTARCTAAPPDAHPATIACGAQGKSPVACRGDVGGPLMCKEDGGHLRLVGVAMPWGYMPLCSSVVNFIHIGHYRQWIEDNVADRPKPPGPSPISKDAWDARLGEGTSVCMLQSHVVCTCSILSPSAALTLASRCIPPENFSDRSFVCAGNVRYKDPTDLIKHTQILPVKKFLPHEGASSGHDVSLVFVEGAFRRSPTVSWAHVPDLKRLYDDSVLFCELFGFGFLTKDDDDMVLRAATVSMANWKVCNKKFVDNLMCMLPVESSVMCHGDEGGPVMCWEQGYHQYGLISSWTSNECVNGTELSFYYIGYYSEWIKTNVHDLPEYKPRLTTEAPPTNAEPFFPPPSEPSLQRAEVLDEDVPLGGHVHREGAFAMLPHYLLEPAGAASSVGVHLLLMIAACTVMFAY